MTLHGEPMNQPQTIYEVLGRGPVHTFPARMAPSIALEVLAGAEEPLRVLDPMMGSGTVLAVARSKGHRAIGLDLDPLAVLISKVWTTAIDAEEVRNKAIEVQDRARRIFATMPTRSAYPRNADRETQQFVTYWFDDYARRQLASLATAINRVHDEVTRDALWCGFSRLIISKQSGASLAMDLSHSRPHKSFSRAPTKPFRKFLAAVDNVVENCIDSTSLGRGPRSYIRRGDARALPLGDSSVDIVLTSPPYLNAIDYMRCSKFSLIWMGYSIDDLRQLRANSIGAEMANYATQNDQEIRHIFAELRLRPQLTARDEGMLLRYINDMRQAIREVFRVLAPGGQAVFVVGENTVRGTRIRNSVIISALAQISGLDLHNRRVRNLPANRRYLPPPSTGSGSATLNTRMRREVILSFMKP
jgi:DNA modification methylase